MDGGAWWAAVHGVTQSWTELSDFTFTFHFHALEKEMAIHSSILAWRMPGMGEPCGLTSMGSQRVGHDWGDLVAAVAAELSASEYQYFLKTRSSFKIFTEGQSQAWKPFRVLWAWVSTAVCSQASNELHKPDLTIISVKNCFHFIAKMMCLSELSETIRNTISVLTWSIWEKNLKKSGYMYMYMYNWLTLPYSRN